MDENKDIKIKELKIEIKSLFNECKDLQKLYQNGFLSFFEFKRQLKKINNEIKNLDREIIKLKYPDVPENEIDNYLISEFFNPLCTCPKYDNKNLIGTELRYYNDNCLIHGENYDK